MSYMNMAAMVAGHLWIVCMILRIPSVIRDSLIFKKCLNTLEYPGRRTLFTLGRFTLPGLLGAPLMLYMHRGESLRPSPAPSIWQVAIELVNMYGVPLPEPEQQPVPHEPYQPHPYFGAFREEELDEAVPELDAPSIESGRDAEERPVDGDAKSVRAEPDLRPSRGVPPGNIEGGSV